MKISHDEITSEHDYSLQEGSHAYGYYPSHCCESYTNLKIDDKEFYISWQTGQSYEHNDYNCPSNDLCISEGGGTDPFLILVSAMYESDFEDAEIMRDIMIEAKESLPALQTEDQLFELYVYLNDITPVFEHEFPNLTDVGG